MPHDLNVENAVSERYGAAARQVETALCCPVEYNPEFLSILPDEIINKDYGCGDPSAHVSAGDTVLDLGAGAGKICYIASQITGKDGRVIGIDANPEMLSLARKYKGEIEKRIGYSNVEFRYGKIQDLKTDLSAIEGYLAANPLTSVKDLARFEEFTNKQRSSNPLVEDASIDVVLSNCVLNLVRAEDKDKMFAEMFRVLKRGGRAAISDIVSDEDIPEHLRNDPELWSGCISGSFLPRGVPRHGDSKSGRKTVANR